MSPSRLRAETFGLDLLGAVLGAFLVVPVLALALTSTPAELAAGLRHPLVWPALRLSLFTSAVSLALTLCFGTPLAYALARGRGRLARALETLFELPIVIPPAVAGVALLVTFGRQGLFGLPIAFTTAAVVVAETFVSAPLFVQAATSAFRRVDPNLYVVARSFGASPASVFRRIALPLALPGLVAGAATSLARSLGEFGATLMFAGNLGGRTQTLPLAIYTALEADLRAARALSVVLVAVAFALLLVVRGFVGSSSRSART